jgi:hypothetical protein
MQKMKNLFFQKDKWSWKTFSYTNQEKEKTQTKSEMQQETAWLIPLKYKGS